MLAWVGDRRIAEYLVSNYPIEHVRAALADARHFGYQRFGVPEELYKRATEQGYMPLVD